jgi:hypothetical protein
MLADDALGNEAGISASGAACANVDAVGTWIFSQWRATLGASAPHHGATLG